MAVTELLYGQPIIATMVVEAVPTTARWRVTPPGASADTVYVTGVDSEATTPASRSYQLVILPAILGLWLIRFEGVGGNPDAAEMWVQVTGSRSIAPALS